MRISLLAGYVDVSNVFTKKSPVLITIFSAPLYSILFVIASDDTEATKHLDLFYKDEKIGVAIEY